MQSSVLRDFFNSILPFFVSGNGRFICVSSRFPVDFCFVLGFAVLSFCVDICQGK